MLSTLAGDYATALGECLYKNTTSADKTTLTQWAFVTLGKSSATKSIASIPAAKTQEIDQKTKNLLMKLATSSCSKEAVQVALHEPTTRPAGCRNRHEYRNDTRADPDTGKKRPLQFPVDFR